MARKYSKQTLVYLLEMALITAFFVWLSSHVQNISGTFDLIERSVMIFVLYQGLVVLINKNQLDVKKDSLFALKTILERADFYFETENQSIKKMLLSKIEDYSDSKYFQSKEDYQVIEKIKFHLETVSLEDSARVKEVKNGIQYALIEIEHALNFEDLGWQKTFLVRRLK